METLGNEIMPKLCSKFYCNICDYRTSKKSSFDNHCLSIKHTKNANGNVLETLGNEIMLKLCPVNYSCEKCQKNFKNRSGLWKHNKKCILEKNIYITPTEKKNETDQTDKDIIKLLLQQNNELQNKVLEICKNNTINNSNNIITNNSHNKTFNLQFFLNETCKNAMNIKDFVNSIKLQLTDLESVSRLGYVDGLSKIIIKNLNALDVTERPVHCSDPKRDTMYVKDEDKWEKEAEDNHIVLKAIEDIANKNSKQVKEWKIKNPDCSSSKSNKSDQYCHILMKVVCSNNDDNNAKVLKKIAKEVTIDKSL